MGTPARAPYGCLISILRDIRENVVDCKVTLVGVSLADAVKQIDRAFAHGTQGVEDLGLLSKLFVEHWALKLYSQEE